MLQIVIMVNAIGKFDKLLSGDDVRAAQLAPGLGSRNSLDSFRKRTSGSR